MSANIPFEIQVEIMKRAPAEALLRFRSVSKQWKSVIDSSEFITHHTANRHHVLVGYEVASDEKYVLISDDDSFPHHKFSPTFSPSVKQVRPPFMLDCCNGLVCLFGFDPDVEKFLIILWNPSIRKSVGILLPSVFSAVAFGVCPKTSDPKILKIRGTNSMDWKAEVFSLASGAWRSVSMILPYKSIEFLSDQVVADGAIYWVASVKITNNESSCRILSFDLTREEFEQVDLPDNLAANIRDRLGRPTLCVSKLKESLVLLDYCTADAGEPVCDVWMMLKNGVSNPSFTKLFTVKLNASDGSASCTITGFRKNGQPIMKREYRRDGFLVSQLEVYEPAGSEHINDIGIYDSVLKSVSFTESLLLLNHTGSII